MIICVLDAEKVIFHVDAHVLSLLRAFCMCRMHHAPKVLSGGLLKLIERGREWMCDGLTADGDVREWMREGDMGDERTRREYVTMSLLLLAITKVHEMR